MRSTDDPLARQLVELIHEGDVDGLSALLAAQPQLAGERFGSAQQSCTALHFATDWPGRFPQVARTIEVLVAAGAPVDGRFAGPHTETALHWAASSDDIAALDALLDAGADIEAAGAVFTNGTPLSDAVVFAQWHAARRLVARGAAMTIWQAAALGHLDVVQRHLDDDGRSPSDITNACWHACRGGQLAVVQLLVAAGADLEWVGHD
ncbi:MAG: ankyrin repeat domain-containing protein, partial [Ilumatobacteraceae bacterium]